MQLSTLRIAENSVASLTLMLISFEKVGALLRRQFKYSDIPFAEDRTSLIPFVEHSVKVSDTRLDQLLPKVVRTRQCC